MAPRTLPTLTVTAAAAALAEAAAQRIVARLSARSGPLAVCLTGGSTPERLYGLLATERFRGVLPWPRIHWFLTDDRFVPLHDPRSNAGAAQRLLLDRVPVPPENIHPMPIDAANVHEAAQRYDAELRRFYRADRLDPARPLFDIVLMGVGSDGHVASLFPGRPELAERQRWAVGVAEADLEPFVPRVSLTFPPLASTRELLFLVSGAGKRQVMARILSEEDLPAMRVSSEGEMIWLVDRDALPQSRDVEGRERPC